MTLSVFPVLSAIFLALFLSRVHSQGLTFDRCSNSAECKGSRQCINVLRDELCDTGSPSPSCRCLPSTPIGCLSDDACPTGEVCATTRPPDNETTTFLCISQNVVDSDNTGIFVRPTQPNPNEGGLTGDRCRRNSDCLSPRICVRILATGPPGVCIGTFPCICVPPTFTACERDNDCPPGEVCGFSGQATCASEKVSSDNVDNFPNPTGVADPEVVQDLQETPSSRPPEANETPEIITITREVCVAEKHMKDMKGIYETGRHARVLCDMQGSCATPGHLVVFHGKSMMMRTYCDVVGCVERVMKVNSPVWERGLRVESWSDGLQFTAFAARYETVAEEVFLRGLVRVGL